jgi:type IX secretion system PorP/SprF family membrane protein
MIRLKNIAMKKLVQIASVICALFLANLAQAQDAQISQNDAAPILFNPANTGMLKYTDMRVAALYRTQWSSLSTAINTFGVSFDMGTADRWGFGGSFVNTDAANVINSSSFLASGAYQITNPNQTKYILSAGVQLGVLYKRVNTNDLIFDSQFDGFNFDRELPTREAFDRTTRFMFDANIGMSYKSTDRTKKVNPFADIAVFHVTMPNESFIGEEKSRLPMRWMGNAGARIEVNRQILVDASVMYMRQRESNQFLITALGYYEIQGTAYQAIGGLGFRTADAVIVHAGIRHNSNIFRISYDVNISDLSSYSQNRGALEFTVIYRPGRRTSRAIY